MTDIDPNKKPAPKPKGENTFLNALQSSLGLRSKFLGATAGLATMGAVASTTPASSQTQTDTIPEKTIVQKSPILEDPTLIGITWDEALAFDKKCSCAPKMEGLERWSIKLMAGSRHFGQRTYTEDYTYTKSFAEVYPKYTNMPGLEGKDFGDLTFTEEREVPFNEFNPGVGVEYRINKTFHATAGFYKNSIHDLSVYAGVGVETNREKFFGAGIEVGGVTGYHMGVTPSALPYARFGSENNAVNIKVAFVPPIKDMTPAVATVQARVNLDRVFKPK